jgi:uncharacterized protein with von Willebrand factor type A (vWA) domain
MTPNASSPDPQDADVRLRRRLLGFLSNLRANGFPVGLAEAGDSLRIALAVDLSRPNDLRQGLRSLLCSSQTDWRRFDEIFDAYWRRRGVKQVVRASARPGAEAPRRLPGANGQTDRMAPPDWVERSVDADEAATGKSGRRAGASAAENLAQVDLRHLTQAEELARAHDLAERLAARMRYRLSRRQRIRRRGRRLDLRRTIHASIPTGGTPVKLRYRRRRRRPLRLVIILDGSGSMNQYSTFFLRFLHGVLDHFREAEAFLFHTRLVHISKALRERDPNRAVERMAVVAQGLGGGTRIGDSLETFNRFHAKSVVNGRSVVMIVSDGYDTGRPDKLAREMAQLKRRARRIVWLNPMIGWRDYAPEASGMQAALPYVDLFAPAHNLASLAALEPYLARL